MKKRKARTCPDGCQGSGEFASLTEAEILTALHELARFVELPAVNHDLEERAWQPARERMHERPRMLPPRSKVPVGIFASVRRGR